MSIVNRTCIAVVLFVVVGCGSTPLPEEIPDEFLFEYEKVRPADTEPVPTRVSIQIDKEGEIVYEVHHVRPRPAKKKGETTLTPDNLTRLYDRIREAELFELEDLYEGENLSLGQETFRVVGLEREEKVIIVEGTSVDRLTRLRDAMFTILPAGEILSYQKEAHRAVIMDKRTGETFPANHPLVEEIPEDSRVRYKNWWAALNAGGWPSEKVEAPELRPGSKR
ncbi:MAG: hypothetical protein ACYS99_18000 [Planctomycetota bacterium]|jgi:hypothetical protein